MRATVTLGAHASDVATGDLFGANMLAGRDLAGGTYRTKVEALGITHLRWPGGGIAERDFDLTDPEGSAGGPLSGYLALCAELGMQPVIVLPTKRYAGDPDRAAADLAGFLDRLKAGTWGDARHALFEIGNEYYAGDAAQAAMTAADYGEIAALFATMIDSALPGAEVAVQAGKWPADDRAIRAAFDTAAEKAAVDALVFHEYPWRLDPVAGRVAFKAGMADAWAADGIRADLYMSEWNVGSHPDPALAPLHDYGHAQPAVLLEIMAEALRAGVDRASVWGVQQRNKTALSGDEGDGRLFAAGLMFGMLAESVEGKRLIDLPPLPGDDIRIHAFESRTEITVFIAARDLPGDGATVRLDLAGLTTGLAHVRGDRLAMTGDPDAPRAGGAILSFLPEIGTDGAVTVQLQGDHDIVRLTFARALDDLMGEIRPGAPRGGAYGGLLVEARIGEAGNDLMRGKAGNDRLAGGLGNDIVTGMAGRDRLSGGAGNDVIDGGMGADRLAGNLGSDRLSGGWGNDRLRGGDGTDWLDGGPGNDRLTGGAGMDVFVFAPDTGTDVILDFAPGEDLIDISDLRDIDGFADLLAHVEAREAGCVVSTAQGRLFLRGIDPLDLSETDFLF